MGNARALKCKHDAEDDEARKIQCLEAQLALEATNREPELQPVRSMRAVASVQIELTLSRSHC